MQGQTWDSSTWNYTTTFDLASGVGGGGAVFLVADGIKMVADIVVNGIEVGYTSDQFLRYKWDVSSLLHPTGNTLVVSFPTGADARNSEQRWMACSGGWDWAPYSTTRASGATTFSKGIWKRYDTNDRKVALCLWEA